MVVGNEAQAGCVGDLFVDFYEGCEAEVYGVNLWLQLVIGRHLCRSVRLS